MDKLFLGVSDRTARNDTDGHSHIQGTKLGSFRLSVVILIDSRKRINHIH